MGSPPAGGSKLRVILNRGSSSGVVRQPADPKLRVILNCGSSSGVEHQLPKLRVEGSNPFSRSLIIKELKRFSSFFIYPFARYLHTGLFDTIP